jgi:hypothetical protein
MPGCKPKQLARASIADRPALQRVLHETVEDALNRALGSITLWGKIFAFAAPRPSYRWAGSEGIGLLASAVTFLLLGHLAAGAVQITLPIFVNIILKKIAVVTLRKVLNVFYYRLMRTRPLAWTPVVITKRNGSIRLSFSISRKWRRVPATAPTDEERRSAKNVKTSV